MIGINLKLSVACLGLFVLLVGCSKPARIERSAKESARVESGSSKIVLKGDKVVTLKQGGECVDQGAVATDASGKTLSVKSFDNVDTSRPGIYGVTYTAVDNAGKRLVASRKVDVKGVNLLAGKNPQVFKNKLGMYQMEGYSYSPESHTKDGSGSIMLKGQKQAVYGKPVTTPTFHLEKGKRYTLSAYMKMVGPARGQNVFFKVSPRGNLGKPVELLWNIAEPNDWEEAVLPFRPTETGDYVFSFLIHKYGYSTDGKLIKHDLSNMDESPVIHYDDFSVVESDGVDHREPVASKIPFESSIVKIDALGNWSVKENGKWKNIFPRFVYQDWQPDFKKHSEIYKEYGFTGYANITDMNKLKTALDTGLKYNCIQINRFNTEIERFIQNAVDAMKAKEIPETAVIMYQFDNEGDEMAHYKQKKASGKWIDEHDKDPKTGKRVRPIFVLNGVAEGLARNQKSSHLDFMDLTGSYIAQHGEATDIRYNPVNTMEYLNVIDKQKAPVSIIQMQAYYLKTFIPMLFKGIIQGGKGLKFWRGGTTHNGSKKDFRKNYWAQAIKGKNGVFAKIDEMLPIIREPLATGWSAVVPAEEADTVAIGKRDHNGKHYLILANFADKDQNVKVSLGGVYVNSVRDFFTKKEVAKVKNGVFSFKIGHFNNGFKVLEMK